MKYAYEPVKGLERTCIRDIAISSSSDSARLDEHIDITVRFSVAGGLRNAFTSDLWEKAWDAWDKTFRMTYHIGIKKVVAGPITKDVIKSQKFVRRATFYWSRSPELNPDYSKKIWVMALLEGRTPVHPKSADEVKAVMFDVKKTFRVMCSDLGKGKHALKAFGKASWGRHIFSERGNSQSVSKAITITCR
jgi:hypothetical protein